MRKRFGAQAKVLRRHVRSMRLVAAAMVVAIACVAPLLSTNAPSAPSFAEVRAGYQPSDTLLLDRHGQVVHELRVDHSRRRLEWAPLADISPALQAAVIASEDRRFGRHGGVDPLALAGACTEWLAGGRLRGASTITMQLATLLDPALQRHGGPRTLRQKWWQMRWAWALERRWSKAEILDAYLNLVTFRGELQGVAAASRVLFGRAPHGLTAAEGLVLAALVRAPNATTAAVERRAHALNQQGHEGVGESALRDAAARSARAAPTTGARVTLAPHVARQLLRGSAPRPPVPSTLDAEMQRFATELLRTHLVPLRARHVQDGAILVADNASGDVLAYVGGSGDLSSGRHVDAVRARRQAGSTLKPFLYALAFDRRLLTPASLLDDSPLEIAVLGGLYRPENYDEQFHGLVSARTALAGSLNIPAVRTLGVVGVEGLAQHLRRVGFGGIVESGDYYGPSLALGSADVSLWELVSAYRGLANGGRWDPLRLSAGERRAPPERRYSAAAAFLVSHILADRDSRSVTFGLESPLATRFWTAVKTGTSKSMRDNWCLGYSRRYTVGVWVGNLSGEPMHDVSGMTGAAPVWLDLMTWLHREGDSAAPASPPGLTAKHVTFAGATEAARVEWFIAGTEPTAALPHLVTSRPHIETPADGTVIAIDPDIPPSQQRVAFSAQSDGRSPRWVLDGCDLGRADTMALWPPQPGAHRLALADEDGHILDTISFRVRGTASTGDPSPLKKNCESGGRTPER